MYADRAGVSTRCLSRACNAKGQALYLGSGRNKQIPGRAVYAKPQIERMADEAKDAFHIFQCSGRDPRKRANLIEANCADHRSAPAGYEYGVTPTQSP